MKRDTHGIAQHKKRGEVHKNTSSSSSYMINRGRCALAARMEIVVLRFPGAYSHRLFYSLLPRLATSHSIILGTGTSKVST